MNKELDELKKRVNELEKFTTSLAAGLAVVVSKLKELNTKMKEGEKNE